MTARFTDSSEATGFMEQLEAMLSDKRLGEWARSTDQNFDTNCMGRLQAARDKFAEMLEMMDSAE